MAITVPTLFDSGTLNSFIIATLGPYLANYLQQKKSIQGFTGTLTEATVAAGASTVVITDPTQLALISTQATTALAALEAQYQADMNTVATYMSAVAAANAA